MSDEFGNANNTIAMANNDTRPMADNSTRPMGTEESNRLRLKEENRFVKSAKDAYDIDVSHRKGMGGESQVYLAKRQSDGAQVVIKIYDAFAYNTANLINRKKIVNFLNENSDYKKYHIMPLWDNGEIELEGFDGENFIPLKKPFDILPYCPEGALEHCEYQVLKNKIIPEILCALNILHSNNLVHRDIKPDNIYMYDGEVLLADFGTTSQIYNTDDAVVTGTQRGTPGYSAPELSDKYFVIASDYYSLGCTIATLYRGKHVYHRLIKDKDTIGVNIAMRRAGLPLECRAGEGDLQSLVNALVMSDESMRAGYDAVKLWLENSDAFTSTWKGKILQGYETPSFKFDFMGESYYKEENLTVAMLRQWEDAKRYLYNNTIERIFGSQNASLADNAHTIVENKETAFNHDLGLAMFLHYLNKSNCPVYWCGNTYEHLSDISTAISSGEADESKISAMLKDQFLSWKFDNSKEKPNEDTLNKIKEIEEITVNPKSSHLGCKTFMYMFDPKRKENA